MTSVVTLKKRKDSAVEPRIEYVYIGDLNKFAVIPDTENRIIGNGEKQPHPL